jgi:hypothetical protein
VRRNVRSGLAPYFMSGKALTKAIWPEAIRGLPGMAGSGQLLMHLFAWKSLFTFFILLSFCCFFSLFLLFVVVICFLFSFCCLFSICLCSLNVVCSHFVVSSLYICCLLLLSFVCSLFAVGSLFVFVLLLLSVHILVFLL